MIEYIAHCGGVYNYMKAKEILKVLRDKILSLKNRTVLENMQTENITVQDEIKESQPNDDFSVQNIQEEYKPNFEISLDVKVPGSSNQSFNTLANPLAT